MAETFIIKNQKKLRCGYSTGSCAAAAASAATIMLFTGEALNYVSIQLPDESQVQFEIHNTVFDKQTVTCAVIKDAGDDPDVTNGLKIYASVSFINEGIEIKGGNGVGLVTKEGLPSPLGTAAINPVPRKMIHKNVEEILKKFHSNKGLQVIISIPGGEEVSKKTYNPRLGIINGLSILGTTGRVEPMSERALMESIKIYINQQAVLDSENILIAPGNYGLKHVEDTLGIDPNRAVKISNFIGETVDYLSYKKFKRVFLIGHIGKLIKVAAGVMNTHSSYADARLETLIAHSARLGASPEIIEALFNCLTTKAALEILEKEVFFNELCQNIMDKIEAHLNARSHNSLNFALIIIDYENRLVAKNSKADQFVNYFRRDNVC